MRIISGTHKGRRLYAPKTLPVRPTTDFAKEALFNILNHRIEFSDISLLDLYSGTGNISYEFASRGTQNIIAVDADHGCVKFIQKTAEELSFPIKAIKADVAKYITTERPPQDVIFADPPYNIDIEELKRIITAIFENKLVAPDGMFIIEHTKHLDLSHLEYFQEARKYGGSVFSFFQ